MKPRLVAVCGSDGVGKTTVAQSLAHRTGYAYVKTPPAEYQPFRDFYEREEVPPFSRFAFYLGSVFHSSQQIDRIISSGQGVIADRYLLSLRIYHEILVGRGLRRFIQLAGFTEPDLTIVLTAPLATIRQRLSSRDRSRFDRRLENDSVFMAKVAHKFSLPHPRTIHISTAKMSVNEVVDECMSAMQPRCSRTQD